MLIRLLNNPIKIKVSKGNNSEEIELPEGQRDIAVEDDIEKVEAIFAMQPSQVIFEKPKPKKAEPKKVRVYQPIKKEVKNEGSQTD